MEAALSLQPEDQLQVLSKIDENTESLQREGKLTEALQSMEKSLILRGHIFGVESEEVARACRSVAEVSNYVAMTLLQDNHFDRALELLKKADVLSEKHPAIRAVTLNNLGCLFRKKGKLRTALSYLQSALKIESTLLDNTKRADTHLNICVALSELKRHKEALEHARTALKLVLLELFGPHGYVPDSNTTTLPGSPLPDMDHKQPAVHPLPHDRVAVLSIAYHNLAVQLEFLGDFRESLSSYEKAFKVALMHLGEKHPLAASMKSSLQAFVQKSSK